MSKPSEAEAKTLSKCFPSHKKFDPAAECVASGAQRKKKAAIKRKHEKSVTVTVIMMPRFVPGIPKGKVRKHLASKGRMLSLKITRNMSSQEMRDKVLRVFNVSTYTVLSCDSTGHVLLKSCDQDIDGEGVLQRRGCLYLCEIFNVIF